ncbi:MAG: hypothetical protein V1875_10445 [Candidatus Altiarchaeota archaeon]
MAAKGSVEVSPIEVEAQRMRIAAQLTDTSILGIGGMPKALQDNIAAKAIERGDSSSQIMEGVVRGGRSHFITYVGGFLGDEYKKEGMEDDDAHKVKQRLHDDLRLIANPKYRRVIELGNNENLTDAERDELGELILEDLEMDKKTGFNMFKAALPLLNNKNLRDEYAKKVLAGEDGIRLLGLGFMILDGLFAARSRERGDDTEDGGLGPKPDGSTYGGRDLNALSSDGISADEFKERSGIDPSKMMEDMGLDPNTPEGETVMREILTNPTTVNASKEPSSMTSWLLASTAHELISREKRRRRQERKSKLADRAESVGGTTAA